jgi:hypothetical protein
MTTAPYIKTANIQGTPSRRDNRAFTSSLVKTTGTRFGFLAGVNPSSQSISIFKAFL